MELPVRKNNRLENYDYSTTGVYFVTICTKDRKPLLCHIVPCKNETVGAGVPDRPQINLSPHGVIAEKYIHQLHDFYQHLAIDTFVIMPNRIHLLVRILANGRSGTPAPTKGNAVIAQFVSTLKRFCNKEYGENIFQRSYHDHVIRGEADYREIWEYIENNPRKWTLDRYYEEQTTAKG